MSEDMLADPLTKDMSAHLLIRALERSRVTVREGLKGRVK
jgi:hypothetical protein